MSYGGKHQGVKNQGQCQTALTRSGDTHDLYRIFAQYISNLSSRLPRLRNFNLKLTHCSTMATGGGPTLRRSSSIACDTDILRHRGSYPEAEHSGPLVVDEEIQTEGEGLFEGFLAEQIQQEGLEPPESVVRQISHLQNSQDWTDEGTRLRIAADAFAQTQERQNVRQQAAGVDVHSLNARGFHQLLDGLFAEGHITRERIVVLFFYCSDVAISALRQGTIDMFNKLMSWIVDYIRDKVCRWVAQQGGWRAVLSGSVQAVQWIVTMLAFTVAGWSVYRWLRSR